MKFKTLHLFVLIINTISFAKSDFLNLDQYDGFKYLVKAYNDNGNKNSQESTTSCCQLLNFNQSLTPGEDRKILLTSGGACNEPQTDFESLEKLDTIAPVWNHCTFDISLKDAENSKASMY